MMKEKYLIFLFDVVFFSAEIFSTSAFLFYIYPIITDGGAASFYRTNYTRCIYQENEQTRNSIRKY